MRIPCSTAAVTECGMAFLSGRLIDRLAAVNGPLTRVGRDLAGMLLAAMVALAVAQILARAIFDYSLDWAEELARMALVWSVFLVAPYAYRRGLHVAITTFSEAFSAMALLVVSVVLNLLVVWIAGLLLVESVDFVRRGMTIVASTLPFRMAWVYSIVPAALVALILVGIELVLRLVVALGRGARGIELSGVMPVAPDD